MKLFLIFMTQYWFLQKVTNLSQSPLWFNRVPHCNSPLCISSTLFCLEHHGRHNAVRGPGTTEPWAKQHFVTSWIGFCCISYYFHHQNEMLIISHCLGLSHGAMVYAACYHDILVIRHIYIYWYKTGWNDHFIRLRLWLIRHLIFRILVKKNSCDFFICIRTSTHCWFSYSLLITNRQKNF